MSFIKIWVHLIWTTKNSQPLLTKNIRQQVFRHICENAQVKNIDIDFINGHVDHLHCLIALTPQQTIDQVVQHVKDESALWINQKSLCQQRFEWQKEYLAVSVSESDIEELRVYIKNQEVQHQKKTFQEEYSELIQKYGF